MRKPDIRTITLTLVALLLPVTLLVGLITAAYFKSANPDNVDITQGLAYLQQTLIASVLTFIVFIIAIVAGIIRMYKRDGNFVQAKLPLYLLIIISILLVAIASVNAYNSKVQDDYLIDNGRPTLQQFFDGLEQQKNN